MLFECIIGIAAKGGVFPAYEASVGVGLYLGTRYCPLGYVLPLCERTPSPLRK